MVSWWDPDDIKIRSGSYPDVPDPLEYCQWEIFNATCDPDEVIMMTHAQYGRMRLGRCLTTDVYIGCGGDVLSQMDVKCSGRQSCHLLIPDSSLHQSQPCPGDMMAYLEASFICTKGK
ncbi:hypothetical protein LSH36_123g05046 [Paralvinella palmiformis]|uniref:SUEL-type lectin domain-containing protein n=1 Tax=Paralvinella palmiformis TaxID=53620 RepID=A0AAD9NBD2_9ANNE|nr:hypothetical protein LSH36_123g05046 [Paralvinella palmiformis]